VLDQLRILQAHQREAVVKAVEKEHGALESETPTSDNLALKAEETELNEPTASPLDEVIRSTDAHNIRGVPQSDESGGVLMALYVSEVSGEELAP
jgi:hypothetical protein